MFYVTREENKELMNTIIDGFESFEMSELNDMIDSNLETLAGCEALHEISEAIANFGFDIYGFEANGVGVESRIRKAVKFIKDLIFKIVNYIKLYFNSYAKKLKAIKTELRELKVALEAALELGEDLPAKVKALWVDWIDKHPSNQDEYFGRTDVVFKFLGNCGALKDYKIVTKNKSSNDVLSEAYTFIRELMYQLYYSSNGTDADLAGKGSIKSLKTVTDAYNELTTILKSDQVVKTTNPEIIKNLKEIGTKPFEFLEDISFKVFASAKVEKTSLPTDRDTIEILKKYLKSTELLIEWLEYSPRSLSENPVKVELENKDEDITAYSKELLSYTKDLLAKFREFYGKTAKSAFLHVKMFHRNALYVLEQIKSNNND